VVDDSALAGVQAFRRISNAEPDDVDRGYCGGEVVRQRRDPAEDLARPCTLAGARAGDLEGVRQLGGGLPCGGG